MATTPRQAVSTIEVNPRLARGSDERFTGYGAMGVPHSESHHLALRDMLASSLGTAYRAIWHRDPSGRWTIFTTADPEASCPRYFGSVTAVQQVRAIEVTWRDDWTVGVTLGTRLSWQLCAGGDTGHASDDVDGWRHAAMGLEQQRCARPPAPPPRHG